MKTDLQKFKDLLDELEIGYHIDIHAGNIKELGILPKYLYCDTHHQDIFYYKNKVRNAVSIVFDKNDEFMFFEGMSF